MLSSVAPGVSFHRSNFCQSNTVVVAGPDGVLLVDPGITRAEMADLAADLVAAGQLVVAGFSTHPHWDHLLWTAELGPGDRYGTSVGADVIGQRLADPNWKAFVAGVLPPDIADDIPLNSYFGRIIGLPAGTERIPWDGPAVRVIQHQAHAPGHAALLVEPSGVLIAGDMLSDVLIPMLNPMSADPIGDYLAALELFEDVVDDVKIVVPGHGGVGGQGRLRARIDRDRAYLEALAAGTTPDDDRLGASAVFDWVSGVHERQLAQVLAQR